MTLRLTLHCVHLRHTQLHMREGSGGEEVSR